MSNYIWTPQEFLDNGHSRGELGDIREVRLEEAQGGLSRISGQLALKNSGIALLGPRVEGEPGSLFLPKDGLIYPIFPSPEPQEEWNAFADNFRHVFGLPGQLHVYDKDAITLPI